MHENAFHLVEILPTYLKGNFITCLVTGDKTEYLRAVNFIILETVENAHFVLCLFLFDSYEMKFVLL